MIALGDPRGFARSGERNFVVLVDASASMKATDVATTLSPTRTRMDDAVEEVRKLVRGLGGADRMLIAQMDAMVTPVSTLTGDTTQLEQALRELHATDTPADFPRALRFANDVLSGLAGAEIVVVSDGNLGTTHDTAGAVRLGATKLSYVPIGKRGRNVAITQFSVRRYPFDRERYEVLLELFNASSAPEEVELQLLGDGKVVDITRPRLSPGERLPRVYPNLSGAAHTLEAVIRLASGEHDDLPADDHAYALLPEPRRIRVACVTSGNTYLEAALLVVTYLDVTFIAPESYPQAAAATYDVTIFDSVAPFPTAGAGGLFYLNPPADGAPVGVDARVLSNIGFDTVEKKSPLLKYTAIDDVYIGRAHRLIPATGDKTIGASEKGALLVSGRRDQHRFLALGFDPRESDLVLRMAWPVFVLNVLDDFAADDPSYVSSFHTGEVWHVPLPSASDEVWLTPPGSTKRRVPVQDGRAVLLGTDAGFYALESTVEGKTVRAEFAANLSDPAESTLSPTPAIEVDGHQGAPVSGLRVGVRSEWWILLLLVAVALATIEWATYHRRLTV